MNLPELIQAIEQAPEGSRALDVAIWRAAGLPGFDERHCASWCRMDGRTDLTRDHYIKAGAPGFSRSMDAAVSLVPKGYDIAITQASGPGRTDWYAQCKERHGYGSTLCHRSNAASGALALCAAALRAIAAQRGEA